MTGRPLVNTHVHLPPNFSAFETAEDAMRTAAAEGVRVMGASNFHDLRIYSRFAEQAQAAGIVPLFGLELISMDAELQAAGTRVNDPANPGRVYLCGKGVNPFAPPAEATLRLAAEARRTDVDRIRLMVSRLRACLAGAGLATVITDETISEEVAERAGVPLDWVVLQERHVARAFQEAVFLTTAPEDRAFLLARAFGGPSAVAIEDPIAVQGEIRSRLMKAGRPAFVAESPVSFANAHRLVLGMDGIPCYPTLADGIEPVCPWETPPDALAARVLARGIHAAELIPNRNRPAVVDEYVAAFRLAGIIVTAGTEHNTAERIPLEPRCVDGSLPSEAAREVFWEGACVIAAHQHLRSQGRPGFVDRDGIPNGDFPDAEERIRWFAALGAELIGAVAGTVAR
ncbi:MAG: PHP domain-containing protein [Candidatus Limnocylindrales bacterium]